MVVCEHKEGVQATDYNPECEDYNDDDDDDNDDDDYKACLTNLGCRHPLRGARRRKIQQRTTCRVRWCKSNK
jgi:hypothetical protein